MRAAYSGRAPGRQASALSARRWRFDSRKSAPDNQTMNDSWTARAFCSRYARMVWLPTNVSSPCRWWNTI